MIETPSLVVQPIIPVLVLAGFGLVGLLYEAFARRSRVLVQEWRGRAPR